VIDLDQQQELHLRSLSEIICRARGPAYAMRWLRRTRWFLRAGLSLNRLIFPRSFKLWNDARIAEYRRENAK
jgi:hypothetical protein